MFYNIHYNPVAPIVSVVEFEVLTKNLWLILTRVRDQDILDNLDQKMSIQASDTEKNIKYLLSNEK